MDATTRGPPRELRTLDASNASREQLVAILHEVCHAVGPSKSFVQCENSLFGTSLSQVEIVNQAIAKVLHFNGKVTHAKTLCEEVKQMHGKQEARLRVNQVQHKTPPRAFHMSNYVMRTVALKFLYRGENYAGFARQEHMPETIERYLLEALVRSKLIETIETARYSRCGRTDRGVSAFGQVVALRVRSNLPARATLVTPSCLDKVHPGDKFTVRLATGNVKVLREVDYAAQLNRTLPTAIRVYAAASCHRSFSARFDCTARVYRYFFLRRNLDIAKMQVAALQLVGQHDFRNFCRIDTTCHSFVRHVRSIDIVKCTSQTAARPSQQLYQCEVSGRAFLWHQVRCMVQVLFLIGSGREEPQIIPQLLDIAQTPRKPQYDLASDLPLVLHDCHFAAADGKGGPGPQFRYTPLALLQVHAQLTDMWEQRSVQAAILRSHLDALEDFPVETERVVQDLDHYAPKLEQLMRKRNLLTKGNTLVKWKEVSPLIPLAKKRKTLPLAQRGTGHSVDECKRKAQERKCRREEEVKQDKLVRTEHGELDLIMETISRISC